MAAAAHAPRPALGRLRVAAVQMHTVEGIPPGKFVVVVKHEVAVPSGWNLPYQLLHFCRRGFGFAYMHEVHLSLEELHYLCSLSREEVW